MASTYIYRDHTSSNRRTWTWSAWIKRSALSGNQSLFTSRSDTSNYATIRLEPDRFHIFDLVSSSFNYQVKTNRRLKDVNGWYHLVVAFDTTQATASNRVKLYVNGEQETSLAESSYPAQNYEGFINRNRTHYIGQGGNLGDKFDGSMSHINFVDGTALTPSSFGETDSTTGEWKIKTSPSVTYGTNGFFILKDGNSTTDQSGESNNWTVSGTLTKTEDCPSNVFCTWNPLNKYWSGGTYSYGNNKIVLPNNDGAWNTGTLGMTSGKYYWEVKVGGDHNGTEVQLGIADKSPIGNQSSTAGKAFGYSSNGEYGIYVWNGAFIGNAVANPYTSYGSAAGNGYIMIAVDLDNNKFYGGANGTWFGSGDPSNGTNGKTIQAVADTVDGCYYPAVSTYQGYTGTIETNFGNGYFADNAISSPGTNASGNGIFKYNVPTGFTALSTKGLNL